MNGGSTKYQATGGKESILGGSSLGFRLHGGYGFDMGNDTVVLVGFDYNATDIAAGTVSGNSVKIKNSWSLSAAPGMLLNDKTLAYVKLSYEAGKLNSLITTGVFDQSVSGFGYGFGLRTEINKTTFLETEIKQVNYKKFTKSSLNITPSATVGSVGVVFKF
jgi:opacity protein-like surface antigen